MIGPQLAEEGYLADIQREPVEGVASSTLHPETVLLIRRVPPPARDWLAAQLDRRAVLYKHGPWWEAMPLLGGLVLVPEPLLEAFRRPSHNELLTLVDNAGAEGRRTIALLFPELVAAALKTRVE